MHIVTTLEMYALRGSISYREISPARLEEILLGDQPHQNERASVYQALVETDATALNTNPGEDLAAELGITLAQLMDRCLALTGQSLGSGSFGQRYPFLKRNVSLALARSA